MSMQVLVRLGAGTSRCGSYDSTGWERERAQALGITLPVILPA